MKEVTPADLLNPANYGVPENVQKQRLDFCKDCKYFKDALKQCSICGCLMPLKVKLKESWCPVGYWLQYDDKE